MYDLRAIPRFPTFELVSFGSLRGSQMSHGVKDLWEIFVSILWILGQMSFWPNARFSIFSAFCPVGVMSFQSDAFVPYVHSVICLSAKCPFGQMSFGHMSFLSYVFRPHVRSIMCLLAISPTIVKTYAPIYVNNHALSRNQDHTKIFWCIWSWWNCKHVFF